MRRLAVLVTSLVAAAMLAAGCSSAADDGDGGSGGTPPAPAGTQPPATDETAPDDTATDDTGHDETGHDVPIDPTDHGHGDDVSGPGPESKPLREGERFVRLAMPEPYTPSAPYGSGTDDYRCFLLDPTLAEPGFVTGVNVLPGNPDVVHHVILFRVPAAHVAVAEDKDASEAGQGWTCFGGTGLEAEIGGDLDTAPWIGAWAPGGGESLLARDVGIPLEPGSRIIMQVHYNLLGGAAPDVSSAELRLAPGAADLAPLETMLLPAPVELPCRAEHSDGPLCDRDAAVADLLDRFGPGAGWMLSGLQLLCGRSGEPESGEVQQCDRRVRTPMTVRAVAGHMHLLGREIRIELNPDGPDAQTLLDIPIWNFDDQRARPLRQPVVAEPGDTVRVTCRHSQELRDLLPSFEGQPDRYVVWGDGTTDEMCLGILLVTRP